MSDSPIYDEIDKPTPIYGNITGGNKTMEPSKKPQPKVIAAAGGTVVGGAVATITIYLIETIANTDIPSGVEGAIITVISAALAFAAGYWKKN